MSSATPNLRMGGAKALLRRITAALILALALPMLIGGVELVSLGGSPYYVIAAIALAVCAVFLWRAHRWGTRSYAGIFIATLLWALAEVGLHIWGLVARLGLLALLGIAVWISTESPLRLLKTPFRPQAAAAALAFVCLSAMVVITISHESRAQKVSSTQGTAAVEDWRFYGGSEGATRYSKASQITAENVAQLAPAWTFSTGDMAASGPDPVDGLGGLRGLGGISGLQVTALQVRDTLYICSERNQVIALEGDTGREIWRFDPHAHTPLLTHSSCRGVTYHEQPGLADACAERIFHGSIDGKLWALDARTGAPCIAFGERGSISLQEGLSDLELGYHMTSPGAVVNGVIVVGAWIPDNERISAPSGVIRAYDVLTGKLAWAWDMGHPERTGAPPAGETYTPGTPNVWSFPSADSHLNLVYLPTGSASPDLWGGNRRVFDDQYGSAVVALDANTGRVRWSFQTTHHDVWDYDVPAQPVLFDIPFAGGIRKALIQPTKRGEIFVLDRATGEPIFPVTERPVPGGPASGDFVAPTQPYSAISVRPDDLSEAQMWGITPLDQLSCRIRFRQARYEGLFTPPGERPTINHPGSFGSISWGGVAIDESRRLLISNKNSIAHYMHLVPRAQAPEHARQRTDPHSYEWLPMEGTPYVARIRPFISALDIPCNQPPWGHLEAIDLLSGRSVWKRTLGTARDNGPLRIPTGLPIPMGVPSQGGAITTASGLTFIAATADRYLRALDTSTGEELWRGRLPAGGQATPMTYISPKSGRQFVVIAAGGHPGLRTRRGDFIVAFALPESAQSSAQGMK